MKRDTIEQLREWRNNPNRKPLIVRGARQVGKTWLMQEFAKQCYAKCAYVNFEDNDMLKQLFMGDFDIDRILLALQLATHVKIDQDTLLIFDELQEASRGITALKYFQEKAPDFHVMAAGSLLGLAMHPGDSFPVGKVEFLDLYPLSFLEFLEAMGQGELAEVVRRCDWKLMELFHGNLCEYLKQYYFVGGMPEVVSSFASERDVNAARRIQLSILDAYDRDFSKHAPVAEVPRIRMVWRSVVAQLSKENRKFVYGMLKQGARARDFELAIEWLKDAGLLYKVNRTKKGLLPLSAYEDFSAFKLFMVDVGLMCAQSNLPASALLEGNRLLTDFKGALTEQYVLQQLKSAGKRDVYYWSADNSQSEIDFLLQQDGRVVPIEVKAEENLRSKSLRAFVNANEGLHGARFSMSPYRQQEWMSNYPLYAVGSLYKD